MEIESEYTLSFHDMLGDVDWDDNQATVVVYGVKNEPEGKFVDCAVFLEDGDDVWLSLTPAAQQKVINHVLNNLGGKL